MRPHQWVDEVGSRVAGGAFKVLMALNRLVPEGSIQPRWAPKPLLKSRQKTRPPLGLPRETDSLCPECVFETRGKVLGGDLSIEELVKLNPGEIKARIFEEDGKVFMEKTCPRHGTVKDRLATNARFFERMETLFPGRDFDIVSKSLHQHGNSSIQYGRGAVLTIDLTNRCNMMCDPCFMDANQVGYVHELSMDDVKKILDDAANHKPRRQASVQFSGGEPTLSPLFVDAVAYSREVGFENVQAASNGIEFAQNKELCRRSKKAGLRFVYLQFDAADNENMEHRGVGNLFEVKQRAIDNLAEVGITVALVVTVVNGINNNCLRSIFDFTLENIQNIHTIAFQPVSFTGRDEHLAPDKREAWRYTLADLAHDFSDQTGLTDPVRDWFPLSSTSVLSDLADVVKGPGADWGSIKCGCHPNCGIGTYVMVNMDTKETVAVNHFLDLEKILGDVTRINDLARGVKWTAVLTALSLYRNFKAKHAPRGMKFLDLLKQIDSHAGGNLGFSKAKRFQWGMLTVAGMWFQDVFNYDFRRTEMCIIPYATQMGEISFCAYNTGLGWRKIVENMHRVSLRDWYHEHGRHAVYAKGKEVALDGRKFEGPRLPVAQPAEKAKATQAGAP